MSEITKIDSFDVTGKIGQGSFGTVYKGHDPFLKRELAIKVCTVDDQEVHKRFFREAEIAGRLQHPSIVTVYSFGTAGELPYLAQEFLEGEDLDHLIRRREPVDPLVRLDYLRQIAEGLAYAHSEGVIHRDVKPGNIRVLPDHHVKIMDFGIAKLASAETQLTQQGVTLGTASYLPPEQVRAEPLDHRADQFSFGVLAYELMSFERPFGGNTLSALVYQILYKVPPTLDTVWKGCPPVLSALVARCLEKKAERRYPDFEALLPALAEAHAAVAAGPPPPPPKPPRPRGEPPADLTITAEQHASALLGTEKPRSPDETQPIKAIVDVADASSREREAADPLTKTMPIDASARDWVAQADEEAVRRGAEDPGNVPAHQPADSPDDVAATVRLSALDPLGERAREISTLIAKGELETAIQELQDTYQEHQEKTAEQRIAVPPPPPPTSTTPEVVASGPAMPVEETREDSGPESGMDASSASEGDASASPQRSASIAAAQSKAASLSKESARKTTSRRGSSRTARSAPPPLPSKPLPSKSSLSKSSLSKTSLSKTSPSQPSPALEPIETKPVTPESMAAARATPASPAKASKGMGGLPRWGIAVAAVLGVLVLWLLMRDRGSSDAPVAAEAPRAPIAETVDALPVATGAVRIDASPWAEVVEVIGEDGVLQPLPQRRHSPLRLPLAVGRYQLTLLHPEAPASVSCAVEVREDEDATCEARFEAPSVTALFKATGWWQ